jgi:nitrite reductase/ring-hydroxylating ferredoxin subunit
MKSTKRIHRSGDRLLREADLETGGAVVLTVDLQGREEEIILHRIEEGCLAYRNRCRHLSVPLDYGDGDVMDASGKLFQCRTHGALFRPKDGICVAGPCHGLALHPVEIIENDGGVYLGNELTGP